jgi:polysaccharide deacetylase family sporulation protein PdaB
MTLKRFAAVTMGIGICVMALYMSGTNSVHAEKKGRYYYERRGEVVWEVSTDQKVIALTFDDGPDPDNTPQILELLKQYHAKATFFVLGSRVEQYPELAKREVLEGHELANHTYGHPGMIGISAEHLREELDKAQRSVQSVTGTTLKIFRPPGGVYNDTVVNTARTAGYMVVMWSWNQDTRDWSNPGVKRIVNRVISNAHNGGIVLFHDSGGARSQTVAALEQILPELKKRGYVFVTVSELLQIQQTFRMR